jgi:hypothetical protein
LICLLSRPWRGPKRPSLPAPTNARTNPLRALGPRT